MNAKIRKKNYPPKNTTKKTKKQNENMSWAKKINYLCIQLIS